MANPAPATPDAPSLEAKLKDEVLRMYQEVAEHPEQDYHFYHGRQAAEMFGYAPEALDRVPAAALGSFAGVGNPHSRAALGPGEDVLDVGSGAGMDSLIAAWEVGPSGSVTGIDFNTTMLAKAEGHATEAGVTNVAFRQGTMEAMPIDDASMDVAISNGVVNLSFRKRRVFEELFRVLRPGGRISFTDIVSARPLAQSIVNDPKLWAS